MRQHGIIIYFQSKTSELPSTWLADQQTISESRVKPTENKSSQETTYVLFSASQNFLFRKMLLESFLFIVFPVSSCSACQMNIITDRKLHLFESKIELPLPSPPNLYLKGLEGCRLQTTVPLSQKVPQSSFFYLFLQIPPSKHNKEFPFIDWPVQLLLNIIILLSPLRDVNLCILGKPSFSICQMHVSPKNQLATARCSTHLLCESDDATSYYALSICPQRIFNK